MSGQKNAYFANSLNTSHRLRIRCGEFKEGDSTTSFWWRHGKNGKNAYALEPWGCSFGEVFTQ